jgi:hypothetical protein
VAKQLARVKEEEEEEEKEEGGMMVRKRQAEPRQYEVIVKKGPSGQKKDGTFGYASIEHFYRHSLMDARIKCDEVRRQNPKALVLIRDAKTLIQVE